MASSLVEIETVRAKRRNKLQTNSAFANFDRVIEGWYWVLKGRELKRGQIKPLTVMGREIIVYRDEDGLVRAMDAYCPHMGAHLAEGRVDGKGVRCFFHHWKLAESGEVTDIPCQDKPAKAQNAVWPVEEKYGMVWLWTGQTPRYPVPFIPELDGEELDYSHGNQFEKGCHPNVVMVNAIDEQHFHSVHPMASSLADGLHFDISSYNENCQVFDNDKPVPSNSLINRFISRFYNGPLT